MRFCRKQPSVAFGWSSAHAPAAQHLVSGRIVPDRRRSLSEMRFVRIGSGGRSGDALPSLRLPDPMPRMSHPQGGGFALTATQRLLGRSSPRHGRIWRIYGPWHVAADARVDAGLVRRCQRVLVPFQEGGADPGRLPQGLLRKVNLLPSPSVATVNWFVIFMFQWDAGRRESLVLPKVPEEPVRQ